jgi:hypothetical protein
MGRSLSAEEGPMPVQLIARKRTTYATRDLRPGDTFEATASDASILIAIGSAQEAELAQEAMPAAGPFPDPAAVEEETPKRQRRRQYRRRDLQAEGSDE